MQEKPFKRKRMNCSEPPQSQKTYEKTKFSISQNVKLLETKVEDQIELDNFQQDLEKQMGESVVSEYVLLDAQILQSPANKDKHKLLNLNTSSSSQEEDSVIVQSHIPNPNNKNNLQYQQQKSSNKNNNNVENDQDELNSNKATSEMYALNNLREQKMRKPIQLNVIVVGESGLGKSTFVDLFLSKRFQKHAEAIRPSTKKITENRGQRSEGNINFNINMIDTPGYTQGTDIKLWYQNIRNYLLDQFEKYNQQEEAILENNKIFDELIDNRVHTCLYFLQGPRIKKTDMAVMKKLQKYVNLIPILAKGDSFTKEEVRQIKRNLIQDQQKFQIRWFDIKRSLQHNPEYMKKLIEGPHGQAPPFLIISSVRKVEIKPNLWVFGRSYKWGLCNIEDPEHSDFNLLYSVLIGHLSLDLIEQTRYYYFQYQKTKKIEREIMAKKEEEKMSKILTGTIITVALGVATSVSWMFSNNKVPSQNIQ